MKIAVLMNRLSGLKYATDTSLRVLQQAERRGWDCYYFTQHDLLCRDGAAFATMRAIRGLNASVNALVDVPMGIQPLADFDIIFMRQDPPFNTEYIYATYALELAERAGVVVANPPHSLRDVNEKMFILRFPNCTPPTLVAQSLQELRAFWEMHQQVVFKPLDGMGGKSVFFVGPDGFNLSVIIETLTQNERVTIMAQRYLPDITTTGDKRILLIDGKPVPFALARFPKSGELRGNLAAGGVGHVVALTARDEWICAQLAPILREQGLLFVGIDVIGDYLTEINVTSPTCLVEIEAHTGLDFASEVLNALERRVKSRH